MKETWNLINNLIKNNATAKPVVKEILSNDQIVNELTDIANKFNEFLLIIIIILYYAKRQHNKTQYKRFEKFRHATSK